MIENHSKLMHLLGMAMKRKQWSPYNMEQAFKAVKSESMGLREAARALNIPVETLRRRVVGSVDLDCRPGPTTVLTHEEARLAEYCVTMSDMGFGLTREGVMAMAYSIVEKTGRSHPFKSGHAGRGWYEGFMSRQPTLTLRTPQPLSYARAVCANRDTIMDFFAKLGAIFERLNLISKPSQIYNTDETGVNIVHKPSKVIAQMGRCNVPALTTADKGKTHTILACVSASGQVLPPFMVYPQKRPVPEIMREGCYPNTSFQVSDNGWITKELFFEWFKLFVQMIPSLRPVLLIFDGHASHIAIDVIEFARSNNVHLLCLPSHTSHVLQPLDVGVFKSFKSVFSKVCRQYMAKFPGRVITEAILASLIGAAFAQSHIPLNILSGFKKCGIYPFNLGEVSDRQIAPSRALRKQTPHTLTFTPEQVAQFEARYKEGYVIQDKAYLAWKNIYHPSPESVSSVTSSLSVCTGVFSRSLPSSYEVLDELLVLPQPLPPRRRKVINELAKEITEDSVFAEMKIRTEAASNARKMKEQRKLEREQKARMRKKGDGEKETRKGRKGERKKSES